MASRPVSHPSREPRTHRAPCSPQVLSCSVAWHSSVCPCLEVGQIDLSVVSDCLVPSQQWRDRPSLGGTPTETQEEQPAGGRDWSRSSSILGSSPGGRAAHWDLSTFFQVTRRRRCFFAIVSYPHSIAFPLLACLLWFPRLSLHFLALSPIRGRHCDTTCSTLRRRPFVDINRLLPADFPQLRHSASFQPQPETETPLGFDHSLGYLPATVSSFSAPDQRSLHLAPLYPR